MIRRKRFSAATRSPVRQYGPAPNTSADPFPGDFPRPFGQGNAGPIPGFPSDSRFYPRESPKQTSRAEWSVTTTLGGPA